MIFCGGGFGGPDILKPIFALMIIGFLEIFEYDYELVLPRN